MFSYFRPSFHLSPFFLLVSLEFDLVLKSFNGVSRKVFEVARVLQGSRMFQESFKDVSRKFKGVYKKFQEVSRVFQGSLRKISRITQESFKCVSSKIEGCFK